MARVDPAKAHAAKEAKSGEGSAAEEAGESAAFEKAEDEDKKLHKVVTKAMKKVGKLGKKK